MKDSVSPDGVIEIRVKRMGEYVSCEVKARTPQGRFVFASAGTSRSPDRAIAYALEAMAQEFKERAK